MKIPLRGKRKSPRGNDDGRGLALTYAARELWPFLADTLFQPLDGEVTEVKRMLTALTQKLDDDS